jgi:hypothetical protein
MRAQITHARSLWVRSRYLTFLPIWSNQRSKGIAGSASPGAAAAGTTAAAAAAAAAAEDDDDDDDADEDDAAEEEAAEEEEDGLRRLLGPCEIIVVLVNVTWQGREEESEEEESEESEESEEEEEEEGSMLKLANGLLLPALFPAAMLMPAKGFPAAIAKDDEGGGGENCFSGEDGAAGAAAGAAEGKSPTGKSPTLSHFAFCIYIYRV